MATIAEHKAKAVANALKSLAKYKFVMFGYWAGVWVHLNQIDTKREPNPFAIFVRVARDVIKKICDEKTVTSPDTREA